MAAVVRGLHTKLVFAPRLEVFRKRALGEFLRQSSLSAVLTCSLSACGDSDPPPEPMACSGAAGAAGGGAQVGPADLVISEVQSNNEGSWIDERGATGDWIELLNVSDVDVSLVGLQIADSQGERTRLEAGSLAAGEAVVLWADDDDELGGLHLPFKLSSEGDELRLWSAAGEPIDSVRIPALGANQVYARFDAADSPWQVCRYASPGTRNPARCEPPEPTWLVDEVRFEPYELPAETFLPAPGLVLRQLHLRPTGEEPWLELRNTSEAEVDLSTIALRIAAHAPHLAWPTASEGEAVALPSQVLGAGQSLVVPVPSEALEALLSSADFEGVVSLFDGEAVVDRMDFMRWPEGSTLTRGVQGNQVLCVQPLSAEASVCEVLPEREVGDRLRHLMTPGDFAGLGAGGTTVGISSVKFVSDLRAPGLVHLLSGARWPLHYTFVREMVDQLPALDRCEPAEEAVFYQGWVDFSSQEYFRSEGRRFLLGTLSLHSGAELRAVEFTLGDAITTAQMQTAFLAAAGHTYEPLRWKLRPQNADQADTARALEGQIPLANPNAPFQNLQHQALTEGVGYGTLRFISADELSSAVLGPTVIVVTDSVPNDIPLVGGLVTEAFQTPLAHVNVLSQSRGTPNASLRGARQAFEAYFDTLVRLEVSAGGVEVSPADPEAAQEYWDSLTPTMATVAPRIDLSVSGVQPLAEHDLSSLPALGAKAAQLAEMANARDPSCGEEGRLLLPREAFAIPVVHSRTHYEQSGAAQHLSEVSATSAFQGDPVQRDRALAEVRELILAQPVDPSLLREIEAAVRSRFGTERVRFRSSSNTEDLPDFNGAGLYDSVSAALEDEERPVDAALRQVWASLYNARAFEERRLAAVDESAVAMGVLVHEAFRNERANGVAVSRNVLDPIRGDIYYINSQMGEASVTNPAPGVGTEQVVYRWGRPQPVLQHSQSSLLASCPEVERVLSEQEVVNVSCALQAVHRHFRPLLDPESSNAWFAMEVEFKLLGEQRQLLIKQARPHSFGSGPVFTDCREF